VQLFFLQDGETWIGKGIGHLRILKYKEANTTRIIIKSSTTEAIFFDKPVPKNHLLREENRHVIVSVAKNDRQEFSLETWAFRVRNSERAIELDKALEISGPISQACSLSESENLYFNP